VKLILSRKAFDSSAGGVANPILDDGLMIPLPIPDKQSKIRYEELAIGGENLGIVASDLTRGRTKPDHFAHLDPDLSPTSYPREVGWRPLFGQSGAAQRVLEREGVGVGDLFLFFGWFRRATRSAGRLRFVQGAPDMHVFWGWLQIGEVISVENVTPPPWMGYHPHVAFQGRGAHNTLYVASETLTLDGVPAEAPGAGTFHTYSDRLRLTKPGSSSRSLWKLPHWFTPQPGRPALGYHTDPERWASNGEDVLLRSVARGQEFVLDAALYPEAGAWVRELLCSRRVAEDAAQG